MALPNPFRLLSAGLALVATAVAGTYQRVDNFGSNPSNVTMYIYVPSQLAAKPPVLVFPHWCHGTAQAAYSGSQYATLSEKYGFVVIYPDSPNTADQCWDVSSNATLTHNAGGDSYGIVSMVKYALNKYNGDPDRVFVTGISSGAMMTNVLIGAYPDIFAGGSAFAGVPFGCFAGPSVDYWNSDCATGLITKTGAEWAKIVKAAYPGYTGWRPKMQVWHGTVDQVLNYTNFLEEIKEWTTVLGLGQTPTSVTNNTPVAGITKYSYDKEGRFEAYSAAGVDHNIANQENVVMAYFDLTCTGDKCYSRSNPNGNGTVPGSGGGASSSVTAAPTSTVAAITNTVTATTAPTGVVKWGQCGGIGYTGPTNCLSGTCNYMNDWYSQCC